MENFKNDLGNKQEELFDKFNSILREMDLDSDVEVAYISFQQKDRKKCRLVSKEITVGGRKVVQLVRVCDNS